MPVKNKHYDGVKLYKKLNNKKLFSSFTLNVSSSEAQKLNFVDNDNCSFALQKTIVDNKLVISRVNSDETEINTVKLSKKKDGRGRITSYNLSISIKEACSCNLINEQNDSYIVNKEIIDDKLVISRAFPQDAYDLLGFIEKDLIGKHLSKRTLLEFLHSVEGDSVSYFNQLHKIENSIEAFKTLICYKRSI
ncbi:MAG: hypothetical protein HFJ41_03825 [Clostridia bacterium]|nr:hypothetical protein [Clostridia bacterium]